MYHALLMTKVNEPVFVNKDLNYISYSLNKVLYICILLATQGSILNSVAHYVSWTIDGLSL